MDMPQWLNRLSTIGHFSMNDNSYLITAVHGFIKNNHTIKGKIKGPTPYLVTKII